MSCAAACTGQRGAALGSSGTLSLGSPGHAPAGVQGRAGARRTSGVERHVAREFCCNPPEKRRIVSSEPSTDNSTRAPEAERIRIRGRIISKKGYIKSNIIIRSQNAEFSVLRGREKGQGRGACTLHSECLCSFLASRATTWGSSPTGDPVPHGLGSAREPASPSFREKKEKAVTKPPQTNTGKLVVLCDCSASSSTRYFLMQRRPHQRTLRMPSPLTPVHQRTLWVSKPITPVNGCALSNATAVWRPTKVGGSQRLRSANADPAQIGFGSTSRRPVLIMPMTCPAQPQSAPALRVSPAKNFQYRMSSWQPLPPRLTVPRRRQPSTFELLRGLPVEPLQDGCDAEEVASDDDATVDGSKSETSSDTADEELLSDAPDDYDSDGGECCSELAANDEAPLPSSSTFLRAPPPKGPSRDLILANALPRPSELHVPTSHVDATNAIEGGKEARGVAAGCEAAAKTAIVRSQHGPIRVAAEAARPLLAVGSSLPSCLAAIELPDPATLSALWQARSDVYRVMKLRRASQRKSLLSRMEEQEMVRIPESPCASAFSSVSSSASGHASFLASREAARAAIGCRG